MTLHNVLRQQSNANKIGKLADKVPENITANVDGENKTVETIKALNIVQVSMSLYNLTYTYEGPSPPEWYGVAAPFLTFMSAFNNRMNEVRTGCDTMPISKTATETRAIKVSQYGLSPAHHCLLDGISFPPHKRSSLAQSIGPMTQLIMVHRIQSTPSYAGRWKKAVLRSIGHLPKAEEIVNKIKASTREEASGLMELVADILLVTGSRAACKAYFPFAIFYAGLTATQITSLKARTAGENGTQLLTPTDLPGIENYDHSGKGAYALWNRAAKDGKFSLNINTSDRKAKDLPLSLRHTIWDSGGSCIHLNT